MKSIGERAKEFREAKGWNTTEMAKAVGTSRQNIESLDAVGDRKPRYVKDLAKVMGCTVDELYGAQRVTRLAAVKGREAYGISVSVLANVASMGRGSDMQDDDIVTGALTLSPKWIGETLRPSRPDALRFVHSHGDSMFPTFSSGDVLLVDTGSIEISGSGGVFVLSAHDELFVKRVSRRMDGSFEVSSDNPAHKTVDTLNGDHAVTVLGRVVWVWNGRKM